MHFFPKVQYWTSNVLLWTKKNPILEQSEPLRGPKPTSSNLSPPSNRKLTRVRANFCLLPCGTSQEPDRNCSEKLVQMNFLIGERKVRTNSFCTNFLKMPKGPGHPGKIPGTSQTPLFETQGRQIFEGEHELFGHHPFAWKTSTPPGGLRTQSLIFVLFSLA